MIIVDNASPADVVAEHFVPWLSADPRVRHLRTETRIPMFANFNRGIAAAKAPYVVFFHDDDVQAPSLVERAVELLEAHPRMTFVGTNYDFIDDAGAITEKRRWIERDAVIEGEDYIRDLVHRGRNMVPMPGIVFRREAIAAGFDESLPIHFGDFTLLMRLAERHQVGLLSAPLIQIRRHEAQASVAMPLSKSLPLRMEVFSSYLDEVEARAVLSPTEVARLRRRVDLQERLALAFGWYLAGDDEEVAACARRLARGSKLLDGGLRLLDRSGARAGARKLDLAGVARRLAPKLRL